MVDSSYVSVCLTLGLLWVLCQIAEVHARALEAEPLVTTLLDHLIDKHGHHDDDNMVMRERDKRMTVRSPLEPEAFA